MAPREKPFQNRIDIFRAHIISFEDTLLDHNKRRTVTIQFNKLIDSLLILHSVSVPENSNLRREIKDIQREVNDDSLVRYISENLLRLSTIMIDHFVTEIDSNKIQSPDLFFNAVARKLDYPDPASQLAVGGVNTRRLLGGGPPLDAAHASADDQIADYPLERRQGMTHGSPLTTTGQIDEGQDTEIRHGDNPPAPSPQDPHRGNQGGPHISADGSVR